MWSMVYSSVGHPSVCPRMDPQQQTHWRCSSLLLWARQTGDIDRLLHGARQHGMRGRMRVVPRFQRTYKAQHRLGRHVLCVCLQSSLIIHYSSRSCQPPRFRTQASATTSRRGSTSSVDDSARATCRMTWQARARRRRAATGTRGRRRSGAGRRSRRRSAPGSGRWLRRRRPG